MEFRFGNGAILLPPLYITIIWIIIIFLLVRWSKQLETRRFTVFFLLLDQYVHYTNLLPWYIRRRLSAIASHWIFIDFIIPVEQRKIPSI